MKNFNGPLGYVVVIAGILLIFNILSAFSPPTTQTLPKVSVDVINYNFDRAIKSSIQEHFKKSFRVKFITIITGSGGKTESVIITFEK